MRGLPSDVCRDCDGIDNRQYTFIFDLAGAGVNAVDAADLFAGSIAGLKGETTS